MQYKEHRAQSVDQSSCTLAAEAESESQRQSVAAMTTLVELKHVQCLSLISVTLLCLCFALRFADAGFLWLAIAAALSRFTWLRCRELLDTSLAVTRYEQILVLFGFFTDVRRSELRLRTEKSELQPCQYQKECRGKAGEQLLWELLAVDAHGRRRSEERSGWRLKLVQRDSDTADIPLDEVSIDVGSRCVLCFGVTLRRAGHYDLLCTFRGQMLPGAPFGLTISAGRICAAASFVSNPKASFLPLPPDASNSLEVRTFDEFDNVITCGGDARAFALEVCQCHSLWPRSVESHCVRVRER